jgi:hypothetical protein
MLTSTVLQLDNLLSKFIALDEKVTLSLPGSVRSKLSKLSRQVAVAKKDFETGRDAVIKELGTLDAETQSSSVKPGDANWPSFLAEVERLLLDESDVVVPVFKLDDFRLDRNDLPFNILNGLYELGLLVDDDSPKEVKSKAPAEKPTEATPAN